MNLQSLTEAKDKLEAARIGALLALQEPTQPAWAVYGLRAPAIGETPPNVEEILTYLRNP